MKTFIKLLLLVLAVTALPARAKTGIIEVCKGTNTNNYVPVYGLYYDTQGTTSQMIYPADMLQGLQEGDVIKSITFHTNNNGIRFSGGTLKVTIGLTDLTTVPSGFATIPDDKKAVATVVPTSTSGASPLAITFSDELVYDGESNLIVETVVSAEGNDVYYNTSWYGINQTTNTSRYRSGSSGNGTAVQFLPYMDLTYWRPSIDVNPTALDFGEVAVGDTFEPAKEVIVTNDTGEDAVWYIKNSKFSSTATSTTILAGATVEIPVTFAPGYTAGTQTGNLIISNGDQTVSVDLSGFGLAPIAATIDPQTVDFGNCSINKSYTATVTLTNIGVNEITPTFTQPDAPFSVTDEEITLEKGESHAYTVTFNPTAVQEEPYTGKFTFTIGDAENGYVSYEVNLQGKGVEMALETNSPVHFGSVAAGQSSEPKAVTFTNPFSTPVTIMDLSISGPFSFAENTPTTLTIQPGESASVDVIFTAPAGSAAINYTGKLTATGTNIKTDVVLIGACKAEGPEAIRDKAFFEGITYTWKEGGVGQEHTSNLAEIATDPDQIIAMLKEVYTNKSIPGNFKRGYSSTGGSETNDVVTYTGVGTLDNNHAYANSYGWNIPGNVLQSSTNSRCYYMDPDQYKPYDEGVTLLLLEMVDDFDVSKDFTYSGNPEADYDKLKEYITMSIKSARVVTEAKRVGDKAARTSGTLFKVDCDKMNKFFFMAKGQLSWHRESDTNYNYPHYYIGTNGTGTYHDRGLSASYLNTEPALFCHMFEQLSPAEGNSTAPVSDAYQKFVTEMESYDINHDCPNVPFVSGAGHNFMMYGQDSEAADCQDIRDMMFIMPDYRMMYWDGRSAGSYQDYFYYNNTHRPSIGVFVIHQAEIDGQSLAGDKIFQHDLKWKSNLDKFLPSDQQYYELWEVVIDDFGMETYEPVYYRNEDGSYVYENGEKKKIVLNRTQLTTNGAFQEKTIDGEKYLVYNNVYVERTSSSQIKTYVIRGRDADGFLSLQMSNQQEVFIPGTDPNEKARMIGATYYSRYNAKNEKNCYSNRLELDNNSITLTATDLSNPIKFYRSSRAVKMENGEIALDGNGNIVYDEVVKTLVATATASGNASGGTLSIEFNNPSPASEYPDGVTRGNAAGYHNNSTVQFRYSIRNNKVTFTPKFQFWDNFTEDVSKNAHPLQYLYKMEVGGAYSNDVRIPVYKTDSEINGIVSLDEVIGDNQMDEKYSPDDVEFKTKVQMSAKSEILRYDAYRWSDKEIKALQNKNSHGVSIVNTVNGDDEGDIAPTGIAGNQGGSYTVSMNDVDGDYYYTAPEAARPTVSTDNPTAWANFIDYYPNSQGTANEYLYAPVVELFTKGYKEDGTTARKDYNSYGGPQKIAATGRMEVTPYKPDQGDIGTDMALMSNYKWYMYDENGNGNWYSYYNVYLNFSQLELPNTLDPDYELYKVRAWRKVTGKIKKENGEYEELTGNKVLGEEVGTRKSRVVDGWYLYEDINFGDDLILKDANGDPEGNYMSKDELKGSYYLGHRSTKIEKPKNPVGYSGGEGGGTVFEYDDTQNPNHDNQAVEELIKNEMRATFGALRMKTSADDPDGTLDELTVEFKVRAYFTKKNNPLIDDPVGSTTWNRDGEAQQIVPGSNFNYYVTEAKTTFTQKASDGIITGVNAVKMDVNREVVGVTYVNPVGQVSSTPWQGVNIVVTRYSDGSTTTKKVIR